MSAQSTPRNRRRDKPVLSCTFCRGRKIRCNRESPCGACVRRGKAAECIYSSSEQQRKDAIDYRPHTRSQRARQRVSHLESLVAEMRDMERNSHQSLGDVVASPSEGPNDPSLSRALPDDHITDDMGKLSLADNREVYTGSSHWATILEDIQLLKDELSEEYLDSTPSLESTPVDAGLMLEPPATKISLLNSAPPLPKEQILAMIPPRKVVDRHVSHFFNAFDMASFILHRNTFLSEYASFWDNPSATPIMWVGLLCSVMTMSAFLQQQEAGALGLSTVELQNMLNTYWNITIHCLAAGDYLRPSRYTVETLALHFAVDQNGNLDTSIGNWILIGVVIRVAMRMGLHRDPSHWPHIRPLQAELRRRLWMILYQMDFFTSTQVGLPRIIKDSQCDTRLPAHFFDNDIGPEHDEVPPERPLTETTTLLYIIHRHTIIRVAAEIYDATEAGPPSGATSVALNDKLDSVVEAIPAWLKYKSPETSIIDSPDMILHRMFLDGLIHKAIYLLHRRSFMKGTVGEESAKSNELCIRSALAILEHQRRISEETQPGGLMFGSRWKVTSALNQEFLQATMMLCFALSKFNEERAGAENPSALHRRDDILEALTLAQGLWEKNADRSIEARKATKAIVSVLQQDLDKSSTSSATVSDGFVDQISGASGQSYSSSFDYGQNMFLDPSLLAADNDLAFGSMLDDFVIDQSYS